MRFQNLIKYCLVLAALVGSITAHAQRKALYLPSDTAYNTFSLRAKAIASFLVVPGMHYSIGGEYGFRKRHAIGIDFAYNELDTKQLHADSFEKAGVRVPYAYSVDRSFLVSYRYYAKDWRYSKLGTIRPYLSGFVRAGKIDYHYDEGFQTDQIKYDERQFSTGFLVGVIRPLEISGLCLDVNIGPFWKWKSIRDIHYDDKTIAVTDNKFEQNIGVRVGLTLMYVFQRERSR